MEIKVTLPQTQCIRCRDHQLIRSVGYREVEPAEILVDGTVKPPVLVPSGPRRPEGWGAYPGSPADVTKGLCPKCLLATENFFSTPESTEPARLAPPIIPGKQENLPVKGEPPPSHHSIPWPEPPKSNVAPTTQAAPVPPTQAGQPTAIQAQMQPFRVDRVMMGVVPAIKMVPNSTLPAARPAIVQPINAPTSLTPQPIGTATPIAPPPPSAVSQGVKIPSTGKVGTIPIKEADLRPRFNELNPVTGEVEEKLCNGG
jgi:hypothetical protein